MASGLQVRWNVLKLMRPLSTKTHTITIWMTWPSATISQLNWATSSIEHWLKNLGAILIAKHRSDELASYVATVPPLLITPEETEPLPGSSTKRNNRSSTRKIFVKSGR